MSDAGTWHRGKCWHGWPVSKTVDENGWTTERPSHLCTLCPQEEPLEFYREGDGVYKNQPFLAVLSGGQDSTTSAVMALDLIGSRWDQKPHDAVFFNYGQRHLEAERAAARKVADYLNLRLHELTVPTLTELGDSALVRGGDVAATDDRNNLPATFTPGRNMLFLTLAAALAYKLNRKDETIQLVTGVCQTDYSGYPDCRSNFVRGAEAALTLALDKKVDIYTPLMHLTKAETVLEMQKRNCVKLLGMTHTCYEGKTPPCKVCPACVLRIKGFAEVGIEDPLLAATPSASA